MVHHITGAISSLGSGLVNLVFGNATTKPLPRVYGPTETDIPTKLIFDAIRGAESALLAVIDPYKQEQSPLNAMKQQRDGRAYCAFMRFARSEGVFMPTFRHPLKYAQPLLDNSLHSPSDHLPMQVTVNDENPDIQKHSTWHMATYNVLHGKYINRVNVEGLSESLMTSLNAQPADPTLAGYIPGLNLRDIAVSKVIREMALDSEHPQAVIALQECSVQFISYLKTVLPPTYDIIHPPKPENDKKFIQLALLYNREIFTLNGDVTVNRPYQISKRRAPILQANLRNLENEKIYRVFVTHVPCDSTGNSARDLANFCFNQTTDSSTITFVMGAMNYKEEDLERFFVEIANERQIDMPTFYKIFELWNGYNTQISQRDESVSLADGTDHILVIGKNRPTWAMEGPASDLPFFGK